MTTKIDKFLKRIPAFLQIETERVETLDDLLFQVNHAIDLAEEGDQYPAWTKAQLHRAKMLSANLSIAILDQGKAA